MHRLVLGLCVCLCFVWTTEAQFSMSSDRPMKAASTETLSKGTLQLEYGYNHMTNENSSIKQTIIDYADILLRYGVGENFEIRAGWGARLLDVEGFFPYMIEGPMPVMVGFKTKLADPNRSFPSVAFLAGITMPYGGDDRFNPQYIAPEFAFAFHNGFGKYWNLRYQLGMAWDGNNPAASFEYGFAIGRTICDWMNLYLQLDGNIHENSDDGTFVGGGIQFWVFNPLIVDFSYDRRLGDEIEVWRWSAGLSWRLQ